MSTKTHIKPNVVIIGRVEKETVGVKSNYKDVVAYARGLIDKHFVAKEESFYIVKTYGDFYYYEIHEGGEGKAYLPSIIKMAESIERNVINDDLEAGYLAGSNSDGDESGKTISGRLRKIFPIKQKEIVSGDSLVGDSSLGEGDSSFSPDTFYIKGNIKCSKIKFNGNNMVFSFASESENEGIQTTNGIHSSIGMISYFSDFSNIKIVAYIFFIVSVLFFLSSVIFREFGFRERVFYVKGEQVINVPQFVEKNIRSVGVASDEYVEKVVFNGGKWVVKKRKIEQKKKPEMFDEMIENKNLLEDGVNAVKTKTLR